MNVAEIQPPFLLTPYHCSNWFPFVAVVSDQGLKIEAKPTPKKAIAWTTALIGVVFLGFLWLMLAKAPDAVWGVVAIGVLATAGTPILITHHFKNEQQQGPVLEHQVSDDFVALPRWHKQVSIAEIASVAVVTAHDSGSDWCSQLQLHTKTGERFLLATANTKEELLPILKEIATRINAPIRSLKQKSRNELCEEPQP